jgi:predicted PurR-regulated permease PerM
MKKNLKNETFFELQENKNLRRLFLIIFGAVIIGLIAIFRFYFWPLIFAVIAYIGLMPLQEKIQKKLIKSRKISAYITIFLFFIIAVIPISFLVVSLFDQSYNLYVYIQDKINAGLFQQIENHPLVIRVLKYFNITEAELFKKGMEFLQTRIITLFASITTLISFPLTFALNFFFMIIILFLFLKDGARLEAAANKALPFPDDMQKKIGNRLKEVIKVLLAGNIAIMFCQGLMIGIGFYIAGFRTSLLWGSVAAILSLIPVVGTMLIWIPAVIYLVLVGSFSMAIFLGIWSFTWYLILENLIKPKIFGEKLNFHPIVFFFLLLGSIQAFGLPGVIFGPVLLTLFYSLWEIYKLLREYNKIKDK